MKKTKLIKVLVCTLMFIMIFATTVKAEENPSKGDLVYCKYMNVTTDEIKNLIYGDLIVIPGLNESPLDNYNMLQENFEFFYFFGHIDGSFDYAYGTDINKATPELPFPLMAKIYQEKIKYVCTMYKNQTGEYYPDCDTTLSTALQPYKLTNCPSYVLATEGNDLLDDKEAGKIELWFDSKLTYEQIKTLIAERYDSNKPGEHPNLYKLESSYIKKQDSDNNNNNNNNNNNEATESNFLGNLTCGGTSFTFHKSLPNFTSTLYNILKFGTPIVIILTGMLDMFKAVSAQKEDEIKKAQQKFLRRLLAGGIVFLVSFVLDLVVNFIVDQEQAGNAMDCVYCFLFGSDECGKFTYNQQSNGTGEPNMCCIAPNGAFSWVNGKQCQQMGGENTGLTQDKCHEENVCCEITTKPEPGKFVKVQQWTSKSSCTKTYAGKILHSDMSRCEVSKPVN